MKVTPSALRNASAAHQKLLDVLLLRILQLGKSNLNSSQMEIRRAGQRPEGTEGLNGSQLERQQSDTQSDSNVQYLIKWRAEKREDKLSLKTQVSGTIC